MPFLWGDRRRKKALDQDFLAVVDAGDAPLPTGDDVEATRVELKPPSEDALISVVVADLAERFPSIDHARIEAIVRPIVTECFTEASVKTYVGIIAERRAWKQLRQLNSHLSETETPDAVI